VAIKSTCNGRRCGDRADARELLPTLGSAAPCRLIYVKSRTRERRTMQAGALRRARLVEELAMQMQDSPGPAPVATARLAPSLLRSWMIASRPHTLTIGVSPVLVGSALAWAESGRLDVPLMLLSMVGALLLQTGTNLDNDVSDFERGTDRAGRLGLPRATALGLLTVRQVRTASLGCFAVATVIGLILSWHGGWPIFVAGLASAAAAMAYSGGPRPISYTPFGDFVVWIFFGLVAVSGTYYLQTLTISPGVLIAATMVGLPAAAVLVVNNYRDLEPDRAVGKRTLAVCLGRGFSRWQYAALILLPFVLLAPLAAQTRIGAALLVPLAALPVGLGLVRRFWHEAPGPAFNALLARTARFQVLFAVLLSVAILLG
jgi:1,4-dihydroxy-2-naphthoate octaprenyltransferase